MTDIIHRVGIRTPVEKVYAALSTVDGIRGWWTQQTSGVSEPGARIALQFFSPDGSKVGDIEMKVVELQPDRHVHWRFVSGPDDWVDTEATFELAREGDWTIVRFAHRRWREVTEFTEHCSTKWATFLLSLRDFVETGRGRPAPADLWIGNWH